MGLFLSRGSNNPNKCVKVNNYKYENKSNNVIPNAKQAWQVNNINSSIIIPLPTQNVVNNIHNNNNSKNDKTCTDNLNHINITSHTNLTEPFNSYNNNNINNNLDHKVSIESSYNNQLILTDIDNDNDNTNNTNNNNPIITSPNEKHNNNINYNVQYNNSRSNTNGNIVKSINIVSNDVIEPIRKRELFSAIVNESPLIITNNNHNPVSNNTNIIQLSNTRNNNNNNAITINNGDDGYYQGEEKTSYCNANNNSVNNNNSNNNSIFDWKRGELLGFGAFGQVFLGLITQQGNLCGQLCAVKQVPIIDNNYNNNSLSLLEAEIGLMASLKHDNIVSYMGTHREVNYLYIFLEYVAGGSISSLLKKFGKFNEGLVIIYTKQLLLGLRYLHDNQIIHRDLKGANILVDNRSTIKLADFGAATRLHDLAQHNGPHSLHGSPYWMAPEIINQTGYGRQCDIWSLGCVVIEMLCGFPPFIKEYPNAVSAMFYIAMIDNTNHLLNQLPTNVTDECKHFILSCLNKDANLRPTANKLLNHPWIIGNKLNNSNWTPRDNYNNIQSNTTNKLNYSTLTRETSAPNNIKHNNVNKNPNYTVPATALGITREDNKVNISNKAIHHIKYNPKTCEEMDLLFNCLSNKQCKAIVERSMDDEYVVNNNPINSAKSIHKYNTTRSNLSSTARLFYSKSHQSSPILQTHTNVHIVKTNNTNTNNNHNNNTNHPIDIYTPNSINNPSTGRDTPMVTDIYVINDYLRTTIQNQLDQLKTNTHSNNNSIDPASNSQFYQMFEQILLGKQQYTKANDTPLTSSRSTSARVTRE